MQRKRVAPKAVSALAQTHYDIYWRDLISRETTDALRWRKERGLRYSRTPFGFDTVGNQLVPNQREQTAIALMVKWRDEGFSFPAIADMLDARGFTPKSKGKRFYAATVQKVLIRIGYQTRPRAGASVA